MPEETKAEVVFSEELEKLIEETGARARALRDKLDQHRTEQEKWERRFGYINPVGTVLS